MKIVNLSKPDTKWNLPAETQAGEGGIAGLGCGEMSWHQEVLKQSRIQCRTQIGPGPRNFPPREMIGAEPWLMEDGAHLREP